MDAKTLELKDHEKLFGLLSGKNDATTGISNTEATHLSWLGANCPAGGVVVEVGSHRGKSISCIGCGIQHAGKTQKMYCVDLWKTGKGLTRKHYHTHRTWELFQQQTKEAGVHGDIVPMKMASHHAAAQFALKPEPVALLFIDAQHDYKNVSADYFCWHRFVMPGGYVAFHDYTNNFPGVKRLIDQTVIPSGLWEDFSTVGTIWSARRVSQ
jgi:hypothetical protein